MKRTQLVILIILFVLTIFKTSLAQTILYEEGFINQNNKGQVGSTLDLQGVHWNLNVSNGTFSDSNDYFAVQSDIFEAQDVDGTVIWTSESFSIDGYNSLQFSMDAGASGDFEATSDIFEVAVIIDNGPPEILLSGSVDEEEPGDPMFFGTTQLSSSLQELSVPISGTGSNAIIQITANNNAGTELYRFDNLAVTASTLPSELAVISVNDGNPLLKNIPFDLQIQARDEFGNPSTVLSDLNLSIHMNTGSGTISGTTSGVLMNGMSETTITGVMYDTAESGVVIEVTDETSNLNSATSDLLTFSQTDIVLNEIFADPPTTIEGDSNGDGVRDSSEDEFLEFVNTGLSDLDISDWQITDGTQTYHTFPANTRLRSGQAIVIFGGGSPTGNFGGSIVQVASNSTGLGLTNSGDTIILKDSGDQVIIQITYGSEAGNDQSLTRNPKLSGNFEQHTNVDPRQTLFSPGTQVGGYSFLPYLEISGGEGWRMLSTPTSDNTYDDLLHPIWTEGIFEGADQASGNANVFTYDGTQFSPIDNLNETMTKGTGFLVYIHEDDDADPNTVDSFPKVLEMSGTVNSGPVSPSINTMEGPDGTEPSTLVGNPYLTPIDWDDVFGNSGTSNLLGTVYVYDHNYGTVSESTDEQANGVAGSYRAWNGSTGTLTGGLIAPFQGFWVVYDGSGNPSIEILESNQSSGGKFYKDFNSKPVTLQIKVETQNMFNTASFSFSEDGRFGPDPYDGLELSPLDHGDYISLASNTERALLDINNLPLEFTSSIEIPLHAAAYRAIENGWENIRTPVTFTWTELQNVPVNWQVRLKDQRTGQTVLLTEAESYSTILYKKIADVTDKKPFQPMQKQAIARDKSSGKSRFYLVIDSSPDLNNQSADLPANFALHQNYPNPFNPTTTIPFEVPQKTDLQLDIYNMMGQRIATLIDETKAPGTYEVNWDARQMSSGVYYIRLRAGSTVLNRQITLIK